LLQHHASVRGDPRVAPEGGFDSGAAFRHHRCACRVHGNDVIHELVQAFEMLPPEVFGES
jgi:hypothetical protein